MANTYSHNRTQLVFAVYKRESLIPDNYREIVEKYITAIIQSKRHKLLAIYCMPDHIHILIGQHPAESTSDLVKRIKTESTKFIKGQPWMRTNFSWQKGFGVFTYSKSHTDRVVRYILNQKEHHRRKTFREEYIHILKNFEIDYDEKYLFDFYDNCA